MPSWMRWTSCCGEDPAPGLPADVVRRHRRGSSGAARCAGGCNGSPLVLSFAHTIICLDGFSARLARPSSLSLSQPSLSPTPRVYRIDRVAPSFFLSPVRLFVLCRSLRAEIAHATIDSSSGDVPYGHLPSPRCAPAQGTKRHEDLLAHASEHGCRAAQHG